MNITIQGADFKAYIHNCSPVHATAQIQFYGKVTHQIFGEHEERWINDYQHDTYANTAVLAVEDAYVSAVIDLPHKLEIIQGIYKEWELPIPDRYQDPIPVEIPVSVPVEL